MLLGVKITTKKYIPCDRYFVTEPFLNIFLKMEIVFRQYLPHIKNSKCNFIQFFLHKMLTINCTVIKDCHHLFYKQKKRFIQYMMKISCPRSRLNKVIYNSKMMAMHSITNN